VKTNKWPCVWVLTTEFAPYIIGGLGTVATELTRAMSRSRMEVRVISKSQSKTIRRSQNGWTVLLRIPATNKFFDFSAAAYRPAMIAQQAARTFSRKPNAIHVHSLEFAEAALLLGRKYRVPVVYTCHSLVSMEGRKWTRRSSSQERLIRRVNRVVVPSFWLKHQITKRHPGVASKIRVIPNGVRPVSKGTHAPPYRLLYVGRLIRDKGIEPLIRSIPGLSKKNRNVRLGVIGKGSPRYRSRLKSIARKQGVLSKIRWLGPLSHSKVQRTYSSYGAVVVPSKQESFCLVALEAMANGVPLVASRAGGLKEFVNRRNAQIIPVVKSNVISRAIEWVWKHPARTRQRVRIAKRVAAGFHWRKMALRYRHLFVGKR
jgi:glycogen synthase